MTFQKIFAIVLVSCLALSADAFRDGGGVCGSPENRSPHGSKQGELSDGGFEVYIDENKLGPGKNDVKRNEKVMLKLQGTTGNFKGFMIALQRNGEIIVTDEDSQKARVCSEPMDGLTHTKPTDKNVIEAEIIITDSTDLDVTALTMFMGGIFNSEFELRAIDPAPPATTTMPTTKMAPTKKPKKVSPGDSESAPIENEFGMCVDISVKKSGKVKVSTQMCSMSSSQMWIYEEGTFKSAAFGDYCLALQKKKVTAMPCDMQMWTFQEVNEMTTLIQSVDGLCITHKMEKKGALKVKKCKGKANQVWLK